jgi:hypothetical protein
MKRIVGYIKLRMTTMPKPTKAPKSPSGGWAFPAVFVAKTSIDFMPQKE